MGLFFLKQQFCNGEHYNRSLDFGVPDFLSILSRILAGSIMSYLHERRPLLLSQEYPIQIVRCFAGYNWFHR